MHNVSSSQCLCRRWERGWGGREREMERAFLCFTLFFSCSSRTTVFNASNLLCWQHSTGEMLQWEMSRSLADSCTFSTRLRLCVCVCVWEKARQQIERVCAFQACRWDFWEIWRRQVFCLLSLSLFLSLARSLSPLGLCYANVEGCSGFIVIFHLASDER